MSIARRKKSLSLSLSFTLVQIQSATSSLPVLSREKNKENKI